MSIKCEHLLQLSTCFHNELSVVTSIHSVCDITEVFVNDFDYYSDGNYACVEDFASVLPITAPIFIELNLTKFLKLEVVIFFKSLLISYCRGGFSADIPNLYSLTISSPS